MREISCLSKQLSYAKRSQHLASPVKLVFFGLSPFNKTGATCAISWKYFFYVVFIMHLDINF
jgi:hypothetical protein